jgi:hypothetical protein
VYIWLRQIPGQDVVKVEYQWEHSGHDVGTLVEMQRSMMPVALRAWLIGLSLFAVANLPRSIWLVNFM